MTTNLHEVRNRIEGAGGDPDRTRVVAVTKGFGDDAVCAALQAGLRDVGENYAQELVAKAATAGAGVHWHFLGPVQRNKVRSLAPIVAIWQAVDRSAAGAEIARHAPEARVLVQVNVSGEPQKAGCPPEAAAVLVDDLRAHGLDVCGLMTVAAAGPLDRARQQFRALAHLADDLALPERSMGMTADLEAAVQEGATMIRVGQGLFGPRPTDKRARR